MRSSYSVIKSQFTTPSEKKIIETEYVVKNYIPVVEEEEEIEEEVIVEPKIDPEEILRKYEEIGKNIIGDAQRMKQKIETEAEINAEQAEREAYEKGYSQGIQNGKEDGYRKAYEETIEKAKIEAEHIIDEASKILKNAQDNYNDYLEQKKNEVIELAFNIAESIVRKKLQKEDSMNELIEEAFKLSKGEESVVIKINPLYVEELKRHIDKWKIEYSIKQEVFVLADSFIEEGNAIIDKNSGMVKVGIEIGMEQIRKALFG